MPKKATQSNLITGYSDWSKVKTIKEAINVARWNPWLAHEWMEEAARGLSLDQFDIIDFHDEAADKINADWRTRSKYRFYKEKDFWNGLPPKKIRKIIPDDDYDIIRNEEE